MRGTGAPPILLDSDLAVDAGLDSLALAEVADRLDHVFRVALDPNAVAAATTPRDLLEAVRAAIAREPHEHGTAGGEHARPAAVGRQAAARGAGGVATAGAGRIGRPHHLVWPTDVGTLNEALVRHVAEEPHRPIIQLLTGRRNVPADTVTYGSLHEGALTAGHALVAAGLGLGERVGIMLPTGREYFTVFLGVLFAGGVPVPLYPPARLSSVRAHLEAQAAVLDNAGASMLVTSPEIRAIARLLHGRVPSLRSIRTPQALARGAPIGPLPSVTGSDLALIQYTSGSTGDPKGVVLSQAQLLANMAAMADAAHVTSADSVVTWLPLYHDMGLIGLWLTPLVLGLPAAVLSPLAFLSRPASWLEALTDVGGTISAAPNAGYQACVDRVTDAERETLDLSSWRLAFNGSEPVVSETIDAFVSRFEPVGFARRAMCPAYGLAEAGVGVAFSPPGRGPRVDTISRLALAGAGRADQLSPGDPDGRAIVGCGYPLPGYEVRVTGPAGLELPERHEGRVECRGPSASSGYYASPAATRSLWKQGWLDTGDLGYVADGELFLTGRRKDLVIRGGRNLHPEDLEAVVGSLPGLQPGRVAVFSSPDVRRATERLVVVAETAAATDEARRDLEARVRRCTVELLQTPPDVVALVPPGSILRTPSGKVRRQATRRAFEAGTLGRPSPPVPVQLALLAAGGVRPFGRRAVRLLGAWSFALGTWLLVVALGVPLWLAVQLPVPSRLRWLLVRRAGAILAALSGIAVRVEGTLADAVTPQVVVANHPSFVDGLALVLASPPPLTFVTSTDMGRVPLVGSFLRRLGCRFVTRGDPVRVPEEIASLAAGARRGERLVFFPEGSLAPVHGIRPFHLGAFAVAASSGATLVPVAIRGTGAILRPGSRMPHRGTVQLIVGDPATAPSPTLSEEAAAAASMRRQIAELSGERELGSSR